MPVFVSRNTRGMRGRKTIDNEIMEAWREEKPGLLFCQRYQYLTAHRAHRGVIYLVPSPCVKLFFPMNPRTMHQMDAVPTDHGMPL